MGLDNGIVLRRKDNQEFELPLSCCNKYENSIELCYWRKCYGIRNAILRVVDTQVTNEYKYPVTLDNIDNVIKAFKHFLHKDTWVYEGNTIWDWDKYTRRNQARNLVGLYRLKCWLKKHPEDTAYFYDSY